MGWNKASSAKEITQYEYVERKNLRMRDTRQNTHREKERERYKEVYLITMQQLQNDNNLYKGLQSHFI